MAATLPRVVQQSTPRVTDTLRALAARRCINCPLTFPLRSPACTRLNGHKPTWRHPGNRNETPGLRRIDSHSEKTSWIRHLPAWTSRTFHYLLRIKTKGSKGCGNASPLADGSTLRLVHSCVMGTFSHPFSACASLRGHSWQSAGSQQALSVSPGASSMPSFLTRIASFWQGRMLAFTM